MAETSGTRSYRFFILFFIFKLAFSLTSAGILKGNMAISMDAYATKNLMDLLEEEVAVTVGEKARVVIAVMVVVMEEVAVMEEAVVVVMVMMAVAAKQVGMTIQQQKNQVHHHHLSKNLLQL